MKNCVTLLGIYNRQSRGYSPLSLRLYLIFLYDPTASPIELKANTPAFGSYCGYHLWKIRPASVMIM